MLARGANIEIKEKDDGTPLHLTSRWGLYETVQLFLDKGANLEAQQNVDTTSRIGHQETLKLLKARGTKC